ncbi:MAG TPA: c-type cytochrome biogenesis protein CcsB [Actinomycetes bacterium]|nr:c-type cytochrome biogenesis protein CcsB [Actinomycetes bacterium]
MSAHALADLSDQLVVLAAAAYLLAALLLGAELASRAPWLGRAGVAVAVTGLAANAGAALTRALAVGRVPWGNMYEFSVTASAVIVAGFLAWVARRRDVSALGAFFVLPAVAVLGIGRLVLYARPGPLMPALQSGWLRVHVLAAIVGSSVLLLASIFSVLYLVADRLERRGAAPRPPLIAGGARTADPAGVQAAIAGYATAEAGEDAEAPDVGEVAAAPRRRLPAAATLDELAYRTAAFGFPIWTFAIMAGAIWAQAAWGRYWGWDPKETWSFITWVVYAAYLHARATAGWRGRGAAWIAVAGLGAWVFNFYVVNTVLVGLHSYSGL